MIALQCCFCCRTMWISCIHAYIALHFEAPSPPSATYPSRSPRAPSPAQLGVLRGSFPLAILHMVVYMSTLLYYVLWVFIGSVQFSRSVVSDSWWPRDLPVYHQLPKSIQTHIHWVSDTIQPSHPLSSPSPAFNLSQHQGLCQWVSSSHQVAKVLEFQLQHQSFQWTSRTDLL